MADAQPDCCRWRELQGRVSLILIVEGSRIAAVANAGRACLWRPYNSRGASGERARWRARHGVSVGCIGPMLAGRRRPGTHGCSQGLCPSPTQPGQWSYKGSNTPLWRVCRGGRGTLQCGAARAGEQASPGNAGPPFGNGRGAGARPHGSKGARANKGRDAWTKNLITKEKKPPAKPPPRSGRGGLPEAPVSAPVRPLGAL